MVDIAEERVQEPKQRKAISAAKRTLLEKAFKQANGKKLTSPQDYDYVVELLAQCAIGNPANPTYVRAYLEKLQKKQEAGKKRKKKKGTGAFRRNSPEGASHKRSPSPFFGGLFKNRGAKSALKKALANGQWDEAIRHGLDVLKANPWDVPTLTRMATAASEAGDSDSELCYLKAALTKAPKDPTCNRLAAIALDEMGLVNQAILFWERVAETLPKDKEAQWAISEFQIGAKARRRRAKDQEQEEPAEQPSPKPLHVAAGPQPDHIDLAGVCESAESADKEGDDSGVETPEAARARNRFDVLLLSAIGVLAILLWFSLPSYKLWPLCLSVLDVRFWHWPMWTVAAAAMAASLLWIRYRPEYCP